MTNTSVKDAAVTHKQYNGGAFYQGEYFAVMSGKDELSDLRGLYVVTKDFTSQDVEDLLQALPSDIFEIHDVLQQSGHIKKLDVPVLHCEIESMWNGQPGSVVRRNNLSSYCGQD